MTLEGRERLKESVDLFIVHTDNFLSLSPALSNTLASGKTKTSSASPLKMKSSSWRRLLKRHEVNVQSPNLGTLISPPPALRSSNQTFSISPVNHAHLSLPDTTSRHIHTHIHTHTPAPTIPCRILASLSTTNDTRPCKTLSTTSTNQIVATQPLPQLRGDGKLREKEKRKQKDTSR